MTRTIGVIVFGTRPVRFTSLALIGTSDDPIIPENYDREPRSMTMCLLGN